MAEPTPQTYQNHTRWVPGYHFLLMPILVLNLVWSIYRLVTSFSFETVVGLLLAAFYNPVVTGAVRGPADVALALAGWLLLSAWRLPPWAVVVTLAAGGAALHALRAG